MYNSEVGFADPHHALEKSNVLKVRPLQVGGVETLVTTATCPDPIAELHFIKGFKSSPDLYSDLIRQLIENRINIVLVTLPDPSEDIHFLEDYEKIARGVYIDGALDTVTPGNPPKIAANHSTGGFLLTKLLMDQGDAYLFRERYQGTFCAAPFYGTPYYRIGILSSLTRLYSHLAANKTVGTTWLERQFHNAATLDDDPRSYANHKQALYMDSPTKALIERIRKDGFPDAAKDIPALFLAGRQDNVSHNGLVREVAKAMGANFQMQSGGHSQIRQSIEARHLLIDYIKTQIAQKNAPRRARGFDDNRKAANDDLIFPPLPEFS